MVRMSRTPEIMADAAYSILTKPYGRMNNIYVLVVTTLCRSRGCTGNFFIDEEVLKDEGITDFSVYNVSSHPSSSAVPAKVPGRLILTAKTKTCILISLCNRHSVASCRLMCCQSVPAFFGLLFSVGYKREVQISQVLPEPFVKPSPPLPIDTTLHATLLFPCEHLIKQIVDL